MTTAKMQSVERQISELEIVAERNDWEIVDRYIDQDISGATGRDERPKPDRIVQDSTKRLARMHLNGVVCLMTVTWG